MKKWTIELSHEAEKRLSMLEPKLYRRISDSIDALTAGPRESGLDVKPLKGRPEWRLRVGQWRVLFCVDKKTITITVVSVSPRSGAYKN